MPRLTPADACNVHSRPHPVPASIREVWYRAFDRHTTNYWDYGYVVTWPDGRVEDMDRIPNEWLHLVDVASAEVA